MVRDSGGSTTTLGAGEMQENLDATVNISSVCLNSLLFSFDYSLLSSSIARFVLCF